MKICMLLPEEARRLEHYGCEYRCQSSGHKHTSRRHAEELVAAGQALWVGRHKRRIKFADAKCWTKVYQRNRAGETMFATMQLVSNPAALILTPTKRTASGRSGPVRRIAVPG
jgi:hypothetical protein